MNVYMGIGSTGLKAVVEMVKWANKLGIGGAIGPHVVALDTNEAEVRSYDNLTPPGGWIFTCKTIGKRFPVDGNLVLTSPFVGDGGVAVPKSISGGVVSTRTGAGNRRLLGLWSYLQPPGGGAGPNVIDRAGLFNGGGVVAGAAAGGGINVALAVGSLIGGTASGSLPHIGRDLQGVAPGAQRIAVAVLPRPAHESAVRKANAIAALRDLKLQLGNGVWTHVLLASPGYQDGGGSNWLIDNSESESLTALLWMLGLFFLGIELNGGLNLPGGAALANGMYSIGLSGSYVPVAEVKDVAAIQKLISYFGVGANTVFANVTESERIDELDEKLNDSGANINFIGGINALQKPVAVERQKKIEEAKKRLHGAFNSWKSTIKAATPAGLVKRAENLIKTWNDYVDVSRKDVWIENAYERELGKRVFDKSLIKFLSKVGLYPPKEIKLNPAIEKFLNGCAVSELSFGLGYLLDKVIPPNLDRIKEHIRNFYERNNNLTAPSFYNFNSPSAGISVPGGLGAAVTALNGGINADGVVKNRMLELLSKAFPIPQNGGYIFDPIVSNDPSRSVPAFTNWVTNVLNDIKALYGAPPLALPPGDGGILPLVEYSNAAPAPVNIMVLGDGGNWSLNVGFFNISIDSLALFHDDETKKELRSINTYNATRYFPNQIASAIIGLDPSTAIGTWWQNIVNWNNAGGMNIYNGINEPIFRPLISRYPVNCPDGCGGVCFRVLGLPGVFLKTQVAAGSAPGNYVCLTDGVSYGAIWTWGLAYLILHLDGTQPWHNDVKSYFI